MAPKKIPSIRRTLVLKEYEAKETPDGLQRIFSIKFTKKDGEHVFIPRAVAAGLPFSMKDNRMRGVLPVDERGDSAGHVTPVHIDGILEWNGLKVEM